MVTFFGNQGGNKIIAEDPLPWMKVGNKWVYIIDFTGSRDTISSVRDTMTFKIESVVNNVFKVIQHQHGTANTNILYWYVHDGVLKSYYEGHQTMEGGQWLAFANASEGDKYYYAGDKGRYSLKPIKDRRLTTFEIVKTGQSVEFAGRTFSDAYVIEFASNTGTVKYRMLYSETHGQLMFDGLNSYSLIDINF